MRSDPQIVEIFHLLFLMALEKKIDKALYALKGGCNLRFFLKSIRYSEDIDLDITLINKDTLKKNINKILNNTDFLKILYAHDIEIITISLPKQTETTQRWKLGIQYKNSARVLATKLEFSRRKMDEGTRFESVDHQIIQAYNLRPVLARHYVQETALVQKINALIHRTETQARDIFDIKLLLNQISNLSSIQSILKNSPLNLSLSIENALSIGYSEFRGQVYPYLLPEYQDYYDSEKRWNTLHDEVVEALEKLKP